jgi:tRNA(Arg) A34 adenosine deaminase TadA
MPGPDSFPTKSRTAWITAPGDLVLSADTDTDTCADHPLDSAIARLIAGVNLEFSEERYRYLRRPIHCNYEPSIWEKHLVKVCAKKLRPLPGQVPTETKPGKHISLGAIIKPPPHAIRSPAAAGTVLSIPKALDIVQQLASDEQTRHAALKLHQSPRPVAALLLDAEHKLITATVNTNAHCQLLHAEVNLIARLRELGINNLPEYGTIVVSLKPCRMCAALLLELGIRRQNIKIIAAADDPGPFGRHDLLDFNTKP